MHKPTPFNPKPLFGLLVAVGLATSAPALAVSDLVISQLYGGGGNTGATLTNDYVELFNRGGAAISLVGKSVQYASATGTGLFGSTASQIVVLPDATLQPGQYYLIQLAAGTGGTQPLPAPDASGSIAMSASSGKVALVDATTGLGCNGGTTPCTAGQLALIADLVGYGSADFYEGSSAAPLLTNTTAGLRLNDGCTDTDWNGADFVAGAPLPRNTTSALKLCGGTVVNEPIVATCPGLNVIAGEGGSVTLTATDADSRVDAASVSSGGVAGISLGTISPALADGETASVPLQADASLTAGSYPVAVTFSNNEAQTATCNLTVSVSALTPIPVIQGSGDTSPLVGQSVTTEGVVAKVIPVNYGYFIQDEYGDADAATSDGIFVYSPAGIPTAVVPGNRVRLTATVTEYYTLTELTSPQNVTLIDSNRTLTPELVPFPETTEGDLERYEGMLVQIDAPLTVAQNYFQGRYGEVTVAADGRLIKPTNVYTPDSLEALALAEENARRRLTLDDGSNVQNPFPIPYIGEDNTLRAGDTVHGLTGVLYHGTVSTSLRDYKLHPTEAPAITRDNPRPNVAESVGGSYQVASFNVLNYFTTIDEVGAECFPSMTRLDCRGADSDLEFTRQRDKIIAAIATINADVVGLMEIENNGETAVQNLVDGLNAVLGPNTYASVGLPVGGSGDDAIRVAMIYKPARLTPVGPAVSDVDPIHNRPPLAQSFVTASGGKLSAIVNHFKSKGCDGATGLDLDQLDGQGCYNETRVLQAQALLDFITGLQAETGDDDILVIGDLNAYGKEDPVMELVAGGLADQLARYDAGGYSYVFDGESGYLDHALATPTLAAQTAGAAHWHINADEPAVIDYNTEFKSEDLYTPTAYRSSDHDPVQVGIQLDATAPSLRLRATPSVLWPANHKYVRVRVEAKVSDNLDPQPTVKLVSVTSNEPDNGVADGNTVNDIVILDDYTFKLRAERSLRGTGRVYTITYETADFAGNIGTATTAVTVPLH